jgi:hypothetical protein
MPGPLRDDGRPDPSDLARSDSDAAEPSPAVVAQPLVDAALLPGARRPPARGHDRGRDTGDGLKAFGVLALVAAVFALGGRSETLSGLAGPGRDERWSAIDLRASAFSGFVVVCVLIGAWLWELSQGEDGSPYGQIMAVGGFAYLLAIAFLRLRT